MKLEGIKTPCRCQQPECDGQRLTQLHLYARTDSDVEFLGSLLSALMENADAPLQSTDVVVALDELLPIFERVKIAAAKHN